MMKKTISALAFAVMALASVSAFAAGSADTPQAPQAPTGSYYCPGPQRCYSPSNTTSQQGYGCGGYYNGQNQSNK